MQQRRTFLASASASALALGSCTRSLRLTSGSKEGAEGVLVGEIASKLLEKKLEARVDRQLGIGTTSALFQAVQGGDVHFYLEYARIAYKVFFKVEDPLDLQMSQDKLREQFRSNASCEWLPPLGFVSNYAVIARADNPALTEKKNLSEVSSDKTGWKLGFTSDFSQSIEGYGYLKTSYEIAERTAPRIEPIGQLYFGLNEKRIDLLVTTTTDPLALSPNYKIIADDREAFIRNRASLLAHGPTIDAHPELLATLKLLSGKIDNATMLRLNGEVLVKKRGIPDVAAEWLQASGLV